MKTFLFIYFISASQLMAKEYRSNKPHMIVPPGDLLYATIVFSDGKEAVAFKSEKAQNILLYGEIPKKQLLQSFKVDITKWKDMKSIAFGEIPPNQRNIVTRDFKYYSTSKKYVSKIYFLYASSQQTQYFIYDEVVEYKVTDK